jgi:translation initiation factor 4G
MVYFRYDRDFLMQFMKVCKEKPDDMPSLDAIGLEPSEQQGQFASRRPRGPIGSTPASARNSIGLGLNGPGGAPFGGKSFGGGGMGQFQAPAGRSSEERFAASIPRAVSGSTSFPRQTLGRTNSTSGPQLQGPGRRDGLQRTHSNRATKRTDSKAPPSSGMQSFTAPELEQLHQAENAWSGAIRKAGPADQNSPEYVDRKVKSLLNKLTMEKFDSISLQILDWANRSINESDGRTLIQVIRLVFEKATDEATWSEMYARLCRFLLERISHDVRDEGIKNAHGKPIDGRKLFRKHLLNHCREDFEREWSAREAAASKAEDDKAAAAAEKAGTGEEILFSDEYCASQKAKRRGLGLVKFIGELFKLQLITERAMHACIKQLLKNPEEEEIESLCELLATVGQALDTAKARNHMNMNIYFSRMQELANSGQISSRIQSMLIVRAKNIPSLCFTNRAVGHY